MSDQKVIPESCWVCPHSANCYSYYGEGTCKYKIAIAERERNNFLVNRKEADSDES